MCEIRLNLMVLYLPPISPEPKYQQDIPQMFDRPLNLMALDLPLLLSPESLPKRQQPHVNHSQWMINQNGISIMRQLMIILTRALLKYSIFQLIRRICIIQYIK